MLTRLIERKAEVSRPARSSFVPPMFCAIYKRKQAVEMKGGRLVIVPMLQIQLDHGTTIAHCCCGQTPLNHAAKERLEDAVVFLLARGADVHARGGKELRAVDHASKEKEEFPSCLSIHDMLVQHERRLEAPELDMELPAAPIPGPRRRL